MLATFVIGLREGLEAALIVGIIAAFLRTNGTRRDVRRMWLGVGAAIALCIAVGVGLQLLRSGLPQRQQEMLECLIAAAAVVMVTFMILWMRGHARSLKGELEGSADAALARGSALALIAMAFFAVLREGFETSVFLLAALQNSATGALPLLGALLGIALSLVAGWLVYRGALRFNMSAFFTVTSVLLVFVAAGLVMKTFRAAYEAGWLAVGQQPTVYLSGLLPHGSVREAIFGGVFGLGPQPVLIEVLAWTLYAVPMLLIVLWPRSATLPRPRAGRVLLGAATVAVAVAVGGVLLAPPASASGPQQLSCSQQVTGGADQPATVDVRVDERTAETLHVTIDDQQQELQAVERQPAGDGQVIVYRSTADTDEPPTGLPGTMTGEEIEDLRGRFPVGITAADAATAFPAIYERTATTTITVEPTTETVVGYRLDDTVSASVTLASGSVVQVGAVSTDSTVSIAEPIEVSAEVDKALGQHERFEVWAQVVPALLGLFALVLGAVGALILVTSRRRS